MAPSKYVDWFSGTRTDHVLGRAGGDKKSNNATSGSVGKASPSKSNSPDGEARRPAGNSKGESPMLREWNSSYHRHEFIAVKYPTVSRPGSSASKPETSEPGK